MEKIGLFGASGAIGQSLAAALRTQRISYRVMGRSRSALDKTFGDDPLAEIVTWEPNQAESVRAAPRGLSAIVHLVGVPYWQFEQVIMRQTLDGPLPRVWTGPHAQGTGGLGACRAQRRID